MIDLDKWLATHTDYENSIFMLNTTLTKEDVRGLKNDGVPNKMTVTHGTETKKTK